MVRKQKQRMTALEYLEQYRYDDMELERIQQEMEKKRHSAYGVSGIAYDTDKVQTSGNNSTEERIYKYLQSVEKHEKQIKEIYAQQEEIKMMIEKVSDLRSRQILRYRYLSGLNLSLVSHLMNYSEVHMSRLHKQALEDFEAIYNDRQC